MRFNAARRFRSGISIVEFVGCVAALGGGVVLGSLYLGVDVKAMAVGLLEKADIDVPASLAPEDSPEAPQPAEESPTEEPETSPEGSAASAAATTSDEQADYAETALDAQELDASTEQPQLLSEEEKLAATKQCWNSLRHAISEEATNRTASIVDPSNWQLFDYLLHRKKGHYKAVEAIEAIDLDGVDQRLKAHVQQVLAWQRSGGELFERAAHLLTDAPAGKLTGPFAQSWQSASTQHRMEEKLVLNKHKAIAGYLEHTQKSVETSSESL